MSAVRATEGCDLLANWACHEVNGERTGYFVPSAAGGRLFRKQGIRGFLAAIAPWAHAGGMEVAAARVVSALPRAGQESCRPLLRPEFPAPRRAGTALHFDFLVPYELAIFRGHFPTVPIVPGALLTGWVTELAREHCGWPHGARCARMLKFRRIVQPGLVYELRLEVSAECSALDFHIRFDGTTCALGSLGAGSDERQ